MGRAQRSAVRFDSPRHLVLRKSHAQWIESTQIQVHAEAHLNSSLRDNPTTDDGPPKLNPGEEQIFSLYAPSLIAGSHTVSVRQHITPPAGSKSAPLDLTSTQGFEVVAPRFSLPAGDIHTVYPPQGHGDHLNILPHVVFNDEHLPWERAASLIVEPKPERNRVPWLALLVFTQDELRLLPSQLAGPSKIFPSVVVQTPTLAVTMAISDVQTMEKNGSILAPIADPSDPIPPDTASSNADFIFIPNTLFKSMVQKYNSDGAKDTTQTQADVQRYKYLAHVRNINTEGMGASYEEEVDQLFSVVVAHRVGPWTIKQPTPVVVHLVSIEGVEGHFSMDSTLPLVALCSLYSWTYQCLPPVSLNFFDAMSNLGTSYQPLRVSPDVYQPLQSKDQLSKRVGQRLEDGYTLSRYRVRTGEQTVALVRGPFVPTKIDRKLEFQSTFDTDLHILDRTTGLMDVSYSLAWQLGKTMAIADQAFTAALARIRGAIHAQGLQVAKANALASVHSTPGEVFANLKQNVHLLATLHTGEDSEGMDPLRMWKRQPPPKRDLSFFSPDIRDGFLDKATDVARTLASSLDHPVGEYRFYNEHNRPYSTDWALMLKWVLDRMALVGVPAHYLITDPSHLPHETLRFFSIDPNWVDALIDGALSICVHLEQDDDQIRTAIKTTLHDYLTTVDPEIGWAPQAPKFGFLLRSVIVKQFPDLIVKAPRPSTPPIQQKMASVLRQVNIDEEVLLVLLDREPGDGLLTSLTISQPPHQQCFAAAASIGPDSSKPVPKTEFEVAYQKIYTTVVQPTGEERHLRLPEQGMWTLEDNPVCPVFDWESRMIILPNYATKILTILGTFMPPGTFIDKVESAALMGIQLNDPMYEMTFDLSKPEVKTASLGESPMASSVGPVSSSPLVATQGGLGMLKRQDRNSTTQRARDLHSHRLKLSTELLKDEEVRYDLASHATLHSTFQPATPPAPCKPLPAPHTRRLCPPHIRPPITSSSSHPGHLLTGGPPPVAPSPACQLSCRALGHDPSKLPTNAGYTVDLVFSVLVTGATQGFRMQALNIYLPVSGSALHSTPSLHATPTPGSVLATQRTGTSRMLSNLRWNPLVSLSDDGSTVVISLLPRTTSGGVDLVLEPDAGMGFLLSEVTIAGFSEEQTTVPVPVEEVYIVDGFTVTAENSTLTVNMGPV